MNEKMCKEFTFEGEGQRLVTIRFEVNGEPGDQAAELLTYFAQCSHSFYMELARTLNGSRQAAGGQNGKE